MPLSTFLSVVSPLASDPLVPMGEIGRPVVDLDFLGVPLASFRVVKAEGCAAYVADRNAQQTVTLIAASAWLRHDGTEQFPALSSSGLTSPLLPSSSRSHSKPSGRRDFLKHLLDLLATARRQVRQSLVAQVHESVDGSHRPAELGLVAFALFAGRQMRSVAQFSADVFGEQLQRFSISHSNREASVDTATMTDDLSGSFPLIQTDEVSKPERIFSFHAFKSNTKEII